MRERRLLAPGARGRGPSLLAILALVLGLMITLGPPAATAGPAPVAARHRPAAKTLGTPRQPSAADWQPGRLLVRLCSPDTLNLAGPGPAPIQGAAPALAPVLAAWHLTRAEALDSAGLYRLYADAVQFDPAAAAAALRGAPGVIYAEPDLRLRPMFAPNDTLYNRQWYLPQINAPAAWDITTGSRDVIVAMVDTGIAAGHPDLAGKLVAGYNFVADSTNTADDNGHGTYTAGLVAATGNNEIGVAGVAWNVRLMPIKILNSDGAGNIGDFARGIRYAVDHGARVINISAGIEYPSSSMHDAIQYAVNHNVVVVASSGNTPDGNPRYPAGYEETIAVSATDAADGIAPFSSYGAYVDVAAPGTNMVSTSWDQGRLGYEWASGTSSSAPLVTGAAALLLSVRPDLNPRQVQRFLEDSADDLGAPGWDPYYGAGRLNVARALYLALGGTPTPAPAPHTPVPPTPPPAPTNPPPLPPTPTAKVVLPTLPPVPATPPPAPAAATVSVNPDHALPGAQITVTGHGYAAGEFIGLRMTGPEGGNHELGTAQAGGDGSFSQAVAVPAALGPGTGTVLALGARSAALATTPLNIDAVVQPGATPRPPGPTSGSRIEGVITGVPLDAVQIVLQVGEGVRAPQYAPTSNLGFYHFDNLSAGSYTVSVNAQAGIAVPAPVTVEVDGQPGTVRVIDFHLGADGTGHGAGTAPTPEPPTADPTTAFLPAVDPARSGVVFFPAVNHSLRGPFLAYWQQHGGLPIFGYPISEEFVEVSATDGQPYRVQYFERNRFEYHPELAAGGYGVLLGLLGRDVTLGRTFAPAAIAAGDGDHQYFPQTGHRLGGSFLDYWRSHGGLPIFGYPISEEFVESGYTVQYFERNRFEYHPEYAGTPNAVLLGLLGVDVARARSLIH